MVLSVVAGTAVLAGPTATQPVEGQATQTLERQAGMILDNRMSEVAPTSTGTLSGTVTNASSGSEVGNASVVVTQNGDLVESTNTNSNGEFSLSLSAGEYTIVVEAVDYQTLNRSSVSVTENETTTLSLELTPQESSGTLSGSVVNSSSGNAIGGATVTATQNGSTVNSTTTDSTGSYSLSLPEGDYSVTVTADGYQTDELSGISIIGGETTTQSFELTPETSRGTLKGIVTDDSSGSAVSGATIAATQNETVVGESTTDSSGEFSLTLPTGDYDVIVTADGYQTLESPGISITDGDTTSKEFRLTPKESTSNGTLSGSVTNGSSGTAIGGATVTASQSGVVIASTTTDSTGSYSLSLAEGDYNVAVTADGYQSEEISGISITGGQTTTQSFELRPKDSTSAGTLSGSVVNESSGTAIGGATVTATQNGEAVESTTTDSTGSFSMPLPAGNYTVVVTADGYETLEQPGIPVTDGEETSISFRLTPKSSGGNGTLSGSVLNVSSENPIAGASVTASQNGEPVASTTTDSNGGFSLSLPDGNYNVFVNADGYQGLEDSNISITGGETTSVSFYLTPKSSTGTLTGTVVDGSSGEPIANASISVSQNGDPVASTMTNSQGEYGLSLAPGEYTVRVDANGYQRTKESGISVVEGETTNLPFQLTPQDSANTGTLSGTVVNASSGNGIGGATITASQNGNPVDSTTTDSTGSFSLSLPEGEYHIIVDATNYQAVETSGVTIVENETTTRSFELASLDSVGILQGTVVDADTGDPISEAIIAVSQDGEQVASTRTDTTGNFSVQLAAGEYAVFINAQGYQSRTFGPVTISEDETITQTIELTSAGSTGTLTGTVTDAETGETIEEAQVLALQDGNIVESTITDESGTYSLSLPAGTYEVIAETSGYKQTVTEVGIAENTTTTKALQLTPLGPAGTLTGTVTDNETGEPIEGAQVAVKDTDGEFADVAQTNSSGAYSLTVPEGTYAIEVSAQGYQTTFDQEVQISENTTTTRNYQLVSQDGTASLSGTVTDNETGEPIEGADVIVIQDGNLVGSARTDSAGQYSISLAPGEYDVQVQAEGYRSQQERGVPITENTSVTMNFALSPRSDNPGTIEGTVVDAETGEPISGIQVVAFSHAFTKTATTDSSGSYSIDVGPGEYTVGVTTEAYVREFREDIPVEEGKNVTVDFELSAGGTVSGTVTNASTGDPVSKAVVRLEGEQSYFARTDQNGKYSRKVPEGNYTVTAFTRGSGISKQGEQLSVTEGENTTHNIEMITPSVDNVSVSYLGGSGDPEMDKISADASPAFGSIQVELRNESASETGPGESGMPSDLEGLGVEPDDRFEISFTVDGYEPTTLLWAVKNVSWSATENGDGSYDVTVRTETVTMAGIADQDLPIGPLFGESPEEIAWPEGEDDTADLGWNRTAFFMLMDMSHIPTDELDMLEGMTIGTNAQTFSRPRLVESEGPNGETVEQLEIYLGAPSETVNGAKHDGFYEAFIPDDVLADWNVTDPSSELQALYKGQSQVFEVEETSDGAWIHLDISYSDGKVAVLSTKGSNFEVSDLTPNSSTVTAGETFDVTANVSNAGTKTGTRTVQLRLEPNGETIRSTDVQLAAGETKTVTFQNVSVNTAGTYNLTVVAGTGASTGNLTVADASSDLSVTSLQADNMNFTTNNGSTAVGGVDAIQITADVTNTGSSAVTEQVNYTLGGQIRATKSVQLAGGETTTVTFTLTAPAVGAGQYDHGITVGSQSATTTIELLPSVTVDSAPARDTTGDGLLNDINGDESFDIFDVQALFGNLEADPIDNNAAYFNFDGGQPPKVDIFDVQGLFGIL